jgi:hypothetical protein
MVIAVKKERRETMVKVTGILGLIGGGIWLAVNGWKFYKAGGVKKILPTMAGALTKGQALIGKGRKVAGAAIGGK